MFNFPFSHREEMMNGEFPHIGHGHPESCESPRGGRGGHFHGHGGGPSGFGPGPHAEFFAGRGRGGRSRGRFRHGGRGHHSASESDGDEYAEFVERFREMRHDPRRRVYHEREGPAGDKTPKGYAVESDSEDIVDVDGKEQDNDSNAAREVPGERGWDRRSNHWHGRGFGGAGEFDFTTVRGGRRGGHGPHAFMMGPPPAAHSHSHHQHSHARHGHFKKPYPRVDIFASETQYVLEIEIPGARKDNITALVNENGQSVTVEGTFPACAEGAPERVYAERRVAPGEKFGRTIPLPGLVVKDSVSAKFADGVLTIVLDKVGVEEPQGMAVNFE